VRSESCRKREKKTSVDDDDPSAAVSQSGELTVWKVDSCVVQRVLMFEINSPIQKIKCSVKLKWATISCFGIWIPVFRGFEGLGQICNLRDSVVVSVVVWIPRVSTSHVSIKKKSTQML